MKIIGCLWFLAAGIAAILNFAYECGSHTEVFHWFFALDTIIVILAIAMFSSFYMKFRAKQISPSMLQKQSGKYKFVVPFLLILTYIMFNITSFTLYASLALMKSNPPSPSTVKDVKNAGVSLAIIGWISDALIYIYLQRDVSDMLSAIVRTFVPAFLRQNKDTNVESNNLIMSTRAKEKCSSPNEDVHLERMDRGNTKTLEDRICKIELAQKFIDAAQQNRVNFVTSL